jgi:uncharacterized protein YkwD
MKGFSPMKLRLFGLLVIICVSAVILCHQSRTTHSQSPKGTLSQAEQDLLSEINKARAEPQVYAGYLEKLKPLFKGKLYTAAGQESGLETQEGWDAVEDAIKFLRAAKPAPALSASEGLRLAAVTHVKDQSASGATGHAGADRMLIEERVKPYGAWQGDIGENLVYGAESAREQILTWLIDDGVKTRGHRRRVMSQDYKVAGVSCGPHPEYGSMCVMAFAGGFTEAATKQPATADKSANVLKNQPPKANLSVNARVTNANNNPTKSSTGGNANTNTSKQKAPRKF